MAKKPGVRAAIAKRDSEPLGGAHDDIASVLARGLYQGQRQQIDSHNRQCTLRMDEVNDRTKIVDHSIGRRILNQGTEDGLGSEIPDRPG